MFGFFKASKVTKELDNIIAEINMNMQNNYKDAAQEALKKLEQRIGELVEQGTLSGSLRSQYEAELSGYQERLKSYSHKDQKPYWTKN